MHLELTLREGALKGANASSQDLPVSRREEGYQTWPSREDEDMSPAVTPNPVVACAVTNEWASRCSEHAVDLEGGRQMRIPASDIATTRCHSFSALIYDLAPWDDRSLVSINRLRRSRPEMPILFYVPPVSRAVALIPRCGGIPNVRIRMQERNGSGTSEFRHDVRWLVQAVPSREIMARLAEVLPEMPSALRQLSQYVLRALPLERKPTVESAARAMGLSKRTLERRARGDNVPPPKELIDWVTLLHVSFIAVRSSTSISKVARCTGINPNDLYRTKKRLSERSGTRILNGGDDWFSEVVAAFAARCRAFDPSVQQSIPLEYTAAGSLTY
jgi:transposase-like protein